MGGIDDEALEEPLEDEDQTVGVEEPAPKPVFDETQDLPWPLRAAGMGGGALGALAAARALGLAPRLGVAGVVAAGAGIALSQYLAPMRTALHRDQLVVQFGTRGPRFRIPLIHVERATARIYNPLWDYGGWGIRTTHHGQAFTMKGNEGVELVLRSGKRVLIGSERADQLARKIREITGCDV
jgi:hypothetical protein